MKLPKKKLALFATTFGVAFGFMCAAGAYAAVTSVSMNDMPEYTLQSAPETALPVHVKPAKPQTVHLDADVGRVVIDQDRKNMTAWIYDTRSIILFPHTTTGGAHFTVYDKAGKPIMARYAVIGDPTKKYIRLHETCKEGHDASCEKTEVYFCPNLCYETRMISSAAPQPLIPQ